MAGFADSLDALWALQKHDAQIVKQQKAIAKASRDRALEQTRADEAKTKLDAEREKLRKLKLQHKELEAELQRLDARVTQLDAQGTQAGNNAAVKTRVHVEQLETQGLELLDAVSAQEAAMQTAEAELEIRNQGLLTVVQATEQAAAAAQRELDTLAELRTAATKLVAAEVLSIYDEVNARHPGNALGHLEGDYCASCQGNLNTQLLMQVRARREILRCPQCLRILDV